jgi:hypothetical protein
MRGQEIRFSLKRKIFLQLDSLRGKLLAIFLNLKEYVYVSGGVTISEKFGQKIVVNTFERFNFKTGKTEILPGFSTPRCGHFSWVDFSTKRIFIACGTNKFDVDVRLNSIEIFDITSNSWSASRG